MIYLLRVLGVIFYFFKVFFILCFQCDLVLLNTLTAHTGPKGPALDFPFTLRRSAGYRRSTFPLSVSVSSVSRRAHRFTASSGESSRRGVAVNASILILIPTVSFE